MGFKIQFNDPNPENNRRLASMVRLIKTGIDPTDGSDFKSASDIMAVETKGKVPVFVKYGYSGFDGYTYALNDSLGNLVGIQILIEPTSVDHIVSIAHEFYHAARGSVYGVQAMHESSGMGFHQEAYRRQNEVANAFKMPLQDTYNNHKDDDALHYLYR